ncbi:MAG: NACHT domain-containing protein [Deltaproteobacteria bacterium]|nr:MAG: NACHT domain-containing protein [Deltaproteobacteria bacterium]
MEAPVVAVRAGALSGQDSARASPRRRGRPGQSRRRADAIRRAAEPARAAGPDRSAGGHRRRTGQLGPSVAPSTSPQRAGIDFTAERARHARFVGRTALLAELDRRLIEDAADRWVVVTGGPGMGKSALLATWLTRREAAGDRVPHHFIRRGEYDWDDPAKLVGSLVAQIAARFPDPPEPEADARMHPAARLHAALQRVSQHQLVPQGRRLVVLIDGLDEYDPPAGSVAAGAPGRDPLAEFLPHNLPPGVSVLCASRPRHPYVDLLLARGAQQLDLDGAALAAENTATVQAFWDQAAPELDLDARFIAEAVDRAGGNPQHAEMLRKHLAGLPPERRRVEDIPAGLAGLLARTWGRMRADPTVVEGLGVLCAAREALTLDELQAVTGWAGEAQRDAFKRTALEVLIETRRTEAVREYRLHHDSIRAYVADAVGAAAILRHHLALAQRLATWPAPADAAARRYALHHALLHRAEAGAWADAWRVAADLAFLELKCRELGVHDAEADVARTAARCRASGDKVHGDRFAALARALGRESHWLRAAPEATAALVWNRLRRSGWSASELDAQLHVPEGAEFLRVRVRRAATQESPALVRDLAGHTDQVTACAMTPDGPRATPKR